MPDGHESRERIFAIARRDTVFNEFVKQESGVITPQNVESAGKMEFKTTIIAFRTADGAIIAADSRGTLGNRPDDGTVEKLFMIDEFSTFGISGFAGDGQIIARLLEREFERFSNRFHPPHPKSKANRIVSYLRAFGGCIPIFVTYDHNESRARIFSYDATGFIHEMKNGYASIGSGSGPIRSQVEAFAPDIAAKSAREAIPAVAYLLRQAARHDIFTGGDFSIHLVTAKGVEQYVIPEALWRLDAVFAGDYNAETEFMILQQALMYATRVGKKYEPAEEAHVIEEKKGETMGSDGGAQ